MVIAQTNEKHLTERIEELRRTLSGSHEKLAVYQRLPMSSQDISSGDDLKREVAELRWVPLVPQPIPQTLISF